MIVGHGRPGGRLGRWFVLSAVLVAGLTTSAVGAGSGQAATAPPGIAPSVVDAAVRSLSAQGLDRTAAVRLLTTQPAKIALADRLTRRLGSRAAGAYLEPRTGTPVVNVLDAAAAGMVRAAGVKPRLVRHSDARLASVKLMLDRTVRAPHTAWAVDPSANRVVVAVASAASGPGLARLLAAAAELGDAVTVRRVSGSLRPFIAGGDEIVASAGWICSAGFNAQRGGGNYIVTAGHCTESLPRWRTSGGTDIGPSTNSNFPTDDYGLIQNVGVGAVGAVNLYNGSTQPISRAAGAFVGEQVCKSGRTTQVTCGSVSALNATVNYGNGDIVYGLIQTNVLARGGDSGGALFDGSSGLGMTSGGNSTTTYFQPLPEALSSYGLTLLGGGGPPPPPPGGTGPITGLAGKCVDVQYSNSGNGTPIQLWDCNGTGAQRWTVQGNTLRALGKCMDVTYSGTANGTKIQLWDCNGTGAQAWQAQSNGTLRNANSGKCLDVPGSNSANGTQLVIWTCNGGANQVWRLP